MIFSEGHTTQSQMDSSIHNSQVFIYHNERRSFIAFFSSPFSCCYQSLSLFYSSLKIPEKYYPPLHISLIPLGNYFVTNHQHLPKGKYSHSRLIGGHHGLSAIRLLEIILYIEWTRRTRKRTKKNFVRTYEYLFEQFNYPGRAKFYSVTVIDNWLTATRPPLHIRVQFNHLDHANRPYL